MNLAFRRAVEVTLGREGGYSDHEADRGGATKWGVTHGTYDMWRALRGLPLRPVRDMDRDEMLAIYHENYWLPARCDEMPLDLATCHFDAAVNHGVKRANRLLQSALAVDCDGRIGPVTLRALSDAVTALGEGAVISEYLRERREYFKAIVFNDPSQQVFARGWSNRVDHLAKVLLKDDEGTA